MTRLVLILLCVTVPAIAFASTGGDASTGTLVLQAVTVAINTYIASRLAPLERRVRNTEVRLDDVENGIVR